jgi:hypothetical protein
MVKSKIVHQRKPTKRVRNAQLKGEFGMQDLKNIGQKIGNAVKGVKERVSPSPIPVARPSNTQYQSPRTPSRNPRPVTDIPSRPKPISAPIPDLLRRGNKQPKVQTSSPNVPNVQRTSPNAVPTNVRKTTEISVPTTPKPSMSSRISGAVNSVKDKFSKKPTPPTSAPIPQTPESSEQGLRENLSNSKRSMTAEERRTAKQLAREAKRDAWRSSLKNANNKSSVAEPPTTNIPEEEKPNIINRIKKNVKKFADAAEEVAEDIAPRSEASAEADDEEVDAEAEEPIKLYGAGDHYRTDQHGILYRKGAHGKWISTGKPSKYGVPKEVADDTAEAEEPEGDVEGEPQSRGRTRQPRGSRGSSSADEPTASLGASKDMISSGVLGGRTSGASTYDEKAEKERMQEYEKSGSALNVGSEYISAGSYKGSGYNEQREKERMAKINQSGSPMSAGLGYITAGNGRNKNSQAPKDAHLGEISDADSFSSGNFKFSYGTPKPKPVDVDAQIATELAKATQIQNRNNQLAQLAELQKITQSQPSAVIPQPEVKPNDTDPIQFLFGIKVNGNAPKATSQKQTGSVTSQFFGVNTTQTQTKKKSTDTRSATDMLFGTSVNNKKAPMNTKSITDGSAVTNFFGLNTANSDKSVKKEVGAFGKIPRHTPKPTKSIIDVKVYSPKNFMPDNKGGILGIYEKNAKLKKVSDAPKIRPIASEFLFRR